MNKLNYTIIETATIFEALNKIDLNKLGLVFISDKKNKIIGVATDGDIRAYLLKHESLNGSIKDVCNKDFIWQTAHHSRESTLKLLDSSIKAIPILNDDMQLIDIITQNQFPLSFEQEIYITARSPVRISFAGGGSDLTHYFMDQPGAVLNATISLYCHSTIKQRNDSQILISSLDIGKTESYVDLTDFLSKSDEFNLIRSVIKMLKPSFGFDLYLNSDFPSGSGLGGSSAVTIAILGCFNELKKDRWNEYELAEMAFQAERIDMGISGGWQDQYATVFGGFNFIEFKEGDNLIHSLNVKDRDILKLEQCLFLFQANTGRDSGLIHDDQKNVMQDQHIKNLVKKNVSHCYEMRAHLLKSSLADFGRGMNLAWEYKRQFSNAISNKQIDEMYDYAMSKGALGGKLLGAGGGGYFLFYVDTLMINSFLSAMNEKNYFHTPFKFESKGMQSWTSRFI